MMKNRKGLTLVELLVVVTIIFILSAIAAPQFLSYRAKANNSSASADLRNLKTQMEAVMIDNQRYPDY